LQCQQPQAEPRQAQRQFAERGEAAQPRQPQLLGQHRCVAGIQVQGKQGTGDRNPDGGDAIDVECQAGQQQLRNLPVREPETGGQGGDHDPHQQPQQLQAAEAAQAQPQGLPAGLLPGLQGLGFQLIDTLGLHGPGGFQFFQFHGLNLAVGWGRQTAGAVAA